MKSSAVRQRLERRLEEREKISREQQHDFIPVNTNDTTRVSRAAAADDDHWSLPVPEEPPVPYPRSSVLPLHPSDHSARTTEGPSAIAITDEQPRPPLQYRPNVNHPAVSNHRNNKSKREDEGEEISPILPVHAANFGNPVRAGALLGRAARGETVKGEGGEKRGVSPRKRALYYSEKTPSCFSHLKEEEGIFHLIL